MRLIQETIDEYSREDLTLPTMSCRHTVYVRQSTPKQVRDNRTSQENQYALVERAIHGWLRSSIRVIDEDLGKSGSDGHRSGFQAPVGAVSLGYVGIVLAYEASRLARNNAPTGTLLDLAAVSDTLIADADGVFDPGEYNDRLLLGLRGIMSEAELHLLRLRLDAGKRRQIEQGTQAVAADRIRAAAGWAGDEGSGLTGAARHRAGVRALCEASRLPESAQRVALEEGDTATAQAGRGPHAG